MRAGIELSVSGTTITVTRYFQNQYNYSDDQVSYGSGTDTETISYYNGGGDGVSFAFSTKNFYNASRGVTYTFGHSIGGAYNGVTPSVSASITVPALPPNQMAAPTVTNIAATTHSVNWVAPATNGSPITGFYVEWQTAGGAFVANYSAGPSERVHNASGFSPNTAYRVAIVALSAAGNSAGSPWTSFTSAVTVPAAPSTPTVTRTSDTSHSLSWVRGSQTSGPYASQEVLRRTRTNGAWGSYVVIATVGASSTTYADTSTVANRAYEYQIRATNAAGTATSSASATVWTTPGAPTSQSAAKDAASNIIVTWAAPTSAANPAELKYEVSETTDGSNWTVRTTTAAGVLTYTHTAPNSSLTHTYRIRAIVATTGLVGSGLASGYVSTNTVQLLTPPAAPTNLTSSPSGTVNRAQAIVLSWVHNPLDSSPQSKYTLQHRAVGAGTWTTTVGPITSAVSSYTLPANAYPTGTAFEWQVLTYGLHANPGPYSATATVQISSLPGVSISNPTTGEVVASTSLTVAWAYSDPDGDAQGSWEATLFEGGVPVETKSGANTATSTTFAYRIKELAYTVQVRVRDSRGLWSSPDTKAFTVNYPEPPAPLLDSTAWNWQTGTVEINMSVPAPSGGQAAVDHLEVWRSIDDGAWVRIASDLPPATISYLDTSPTVSGKNSYIVQTVSALPSTAQSNSADPLSEVLTPQDGDGRPGVWLSAGPGFSLVGSLRTEVEIESVRTRERVLRRYAGRVLPLAHEGEHIDETWRVSGVLNVTWSREVDPIGSPEAWLALGSAEGPFLLRAPDLFGGGSTHAYVSVEGPTVSRQKGGNIYTVSFTATRVDG